MKFCNSNLIMEGVLKEPFRQVLKGKRKQANDPTSGRYRIIKGPGWQNPLFFSLLKMSRAETQKVSSKKILANINLHFTARSKIASLIWARKIFFVVA